MKKTINPLLFQTLKNTLNEIVMKAVNSIESIKKVVNRHPGTVTIYVFPVLLPILMNNKQSEEAFARSRLQDKNGI